MICTFFKNRPYVFILQIMARTAKSSRKLHCSERSKRKRHEAEPARLRQPSNRKSHRGEHTNLWSQESMKCAIEEYNKQGECEGRLTMRAIARAFNVPFETMRRRIRGKMTTPTTADRPIHAHQLGKKTVLPPTAEMELAQHIKNLASVGFPCTRDDVRTLAFEYADKNKIDGFSETKKKAGYYWFQGFMARFPELVVKSAENLSVPRAMGMNPVQVSQWFTAYEEILNRLGIQDCPSHIWNFDETGCQNIHYASEVVGQVGIPTYNVTALEKGETSTALIGVNAMGDFPPPMIIHKGKYVGKGWSNGAVYGTIVRASDKGYINKDLFLEFGKAFITFLQQRNLLDGKPHLVVLDSHYSHLYNIEFLELMRVNNVHVFALPPHCSHWLQPLDRGIFRSFKNAWNDEMKKYTRSVAGRKLEKKDFFLVFNPAFHKCMSVANAQGAFRGSGIFPCNSSAIPDHAYAPSVTTDQAAPTTDATVPVNLAVGESATANGQTSCSTTAQPSVENLVRCYVA